VRRRNDTPSREAAGRPRLAAFSERDEKSLPNVDDERGAESVTLDVVDGEGRVIGALTIEPLE
jgi:hypothetical protein